MNRSLVVLLALVVLGSGVLGSVVACGGSERASRPGLVGSGAGGEGGAPGPGPSECTAEREGCLCEAPGDEVDCKVIETFGDYTTCTIGVYTCGDDGRWGPCIGERTTTPL